MRVKCGCIFTRISMRIQSLSSLPELNPLCPVYKDLSDLSQVNDPFCPSEAMGLARITVIFSVISSLFLLSQARYVLADFSSATVTVWDPAEDTDRKAIVVPLEKPSSSAESPPAVEGFHHVADLSLRRPIDRQFLPRETPHGSGRIGFPRRLRGTPEADDVVGKLVEAMAQDLTEVNTEEAKERIPVEWKAKEEEEEEEHKRKKKKKRDHKKKKDREEDSDSDSDSDSDEDEDSDSDSDEEEEEKKEIKKKNKSAKHKKGVRVVGGLMKRFWAFVNRF